MALIQDHHAGYISWEQYERNQVMIAANANMKSRMEPKTGRGGRALLAGLLRCRRCGRMLHVEYAGRNPQQPRYHCHGAQLSHGEDRCISFGGWRADQAVAQKVLEAIGGNAVEAALQAAEQMRQQRKARQRAAEMELEQARYEARLAERRYEAVDPEQRLVAAELESRWNGERPTDRCDPVQGSAVEFGAGSSGSLECSLHGHALEAADRTHSDSGDRGGY